MISILIVLIVLGVALYLIDQIPMPAWVKTVINVLAILFICLWLLDAFGVYRLPLRVR